MSTGIATKETEEDMETHPVTLEANVSRPLI